MVTHRSDSPVVEGLDYELDQLTGQLELLCTFFEAMQEATPKVLNLLAQGCEERPTLGFAFRGVQP